MQPGPYTSRRICTLYGVLSRVSGIHSVTVNFAAHPSGCSMRHHLPLFTLSNLFCFSFTVEVFLPMCQVTIRVVLSDVESFLNVFPCAIHVGDTRVSQHVQVFAHHFLRWRKAVAILITVVSACAFDLWLFHVCIVP